MHNAPTDRRRHEHGLSPNARTSLALAGLALAFYAAVYLNHML